MEGMLEILQWTVPSGAIGSIVTWLFGRTLRQTREAKEVHDTYKQMYEDVSASLVTLQQKNEENNEKLEELTAEHSRTRRALNRLSRAIEAIQLCDFRSQCPVRSELQISEDCDTGDGGGPGRQSVGKRGARREPQDRGRNSRHGDGPDQDHAGTRSAEGRKTGSEGRKPHGESELASTAGN